MTSKTELVIQTIISAGEQGATIQEINDLGVSENSFGAMKASVNASEKKWKDIQIIRTGRKGGSAWKIADADTQGSLKYNDMRAKRAIQSIKNSSATGLRVIGNEDNRKTRLAAINVLDKQKKKLLAEVYAM